MGDGDVSFSTGKYGGGEVWKKAGYIQVLGHTQKVIVLRLDVNPGNCLNCLFGDLLVPRGAGCDPHSDYRTLHHHRRVSRAPALGIGEGSGTKTRLTSSPFDLHRKTFAHWLVFTLGSSNPEFSSAIATNLVAV